MPKLRQIGIDVEVHRAIESARRAFDESENDILRRLVLTPVQQPRQFNASEVAVSRSRGYWSVRIEGSAVAARNLKDAYCRFVAGLAERDPAFLDAFAEEKSRARRFVARYPGGLYVKSAHLAMKHAFQLVPDWYIDTNLSEDQVAQRVRIAARLAGLTYGPQTCVLHDLRQL